MTRMVCCGVWDSAVQAYGRPLFLRTNGECIRAFMDEVKRNDPQNSLFHHPEDYELHFIAYFDDETAEFTKDEKGIYALMRGKDVVK